MRDPEDQFPRIAALVRRAPGYARMRESYMQTAHLRADIW